MSERILMLGNEAVARGAYEAGASVVSSYPGTPSTEITEAVAKYDEIYSEWAPNEKVALEVAAGAATVGARAMTAMKHVGLNVAADPLFTISYIGVNGGLVICVADDQGMHSSQNEQDSRHFAEASKVVMLEPSDSAECLEYTKKAFEISEKYDTPVLLRLSTRVSHSQSFVELHEREERPLREYVKNPGKNVMMPAMARARHVVVEKRLAALRGLAETDEINKIEYNDRKIGVISAGIAYQYAADALGARASYLKLGMVYPLPEGLIREFAANVGELWVIEELDPIIENFCRSIGVKAVGKEKFSLLGEYTAATLRAVILGEETSFAAPDEPIPNRPPVMCAGCPHRGVFYVLSKLKLKVSGDIGCYTLGALPPLGALDTTACMGASISMAHGMEKAAGRAFSEKAVAVIGDSTFIHSGITGLIDVVYNKGCSTLLILDNSITGMTGHQQNPTTGLTLKGEPTRQVDLVRLCEAIGVERIAVVDPFDDDALTACVKAELAADEPSVIICRRPCALLKSVGYSGEYSVLPDKCKKCGICSKIGCPAIVKSEDKPFIEPSQCVGCGYCANLCKFGAITKGDE